MAIEVENDKGETERRCNGLQVRPTKGKKNKRCAEAMSQGKEETKREQEWEFNRKGLKRTKHGERTWTLVGANTHPVQYKAEREEC